MTMLTYSFPFVFGHLLFLQFLALLCCVECRIVIKSSLDLLVLIFDTLFLFFFLSELNFFLLAFLGTFTLLTRFTLGTFRAFLLLSRGAARLVRIFANLHFGCLSQLLFKIKIIICKRLLNLDDLVVCRGAIFVRNVDS